MPERIEFEHMMDGSPAFSVAVTGGLAVFRDHRDGARSGRGKPVVALNASGLRRLQANLPRLIEEADRG